MTTPEPCTVNITPGDSGGVSVDLVVPCSEGPVTFNLLAERDNDGDWRVFLPWPSLIESEWGFVKPNGRFHMDGPDDQVYEGGGGILYLAAVEEPTTKERAV